MKNFSLAAILLLMSAASTIAAERTSNLIFNVQEGSSTMMGIQIGSGAISSDTGTIAGTINATVIYDDETLKAEFVTFTGGRLTLEDLNFNSTGPVFVPGFGNLSMSITAQTRGLVQTSSTFSPPGSVDETGALLAAQHISTINAGTLSLTATVLGFGSETETQNFSEIPESEQLSDTATITITEISSNLLERTLHFTLNTDSSGSETELIEGSLTNLTLNRSEITTSLATIVIPSQFAQWAMDNEIELADGSETNTAGFNYLLVHALDLEADTSTWPITSLNTNSMLSVEISLPESGLKVPLIAQYNDGLDENGWEPLPLANYVNGADSLDLNKTGTAEFTYPNDTQGFIRFIPSD